jgi:hypothetical protein
MRKRWPFALVRLVFLLISCSALASSDRIGVFETISPVDAGISEERLNAMVDFRKGSGSAALLIFYDGKVETKYPVHSIRKAFLNPLYRIHVERDDIDLDVTLEELGIDDIPRRKTPTQIHTLPRIRIASCGFANAHINP